MQGTWVRALVREDPTCCGATKPVCHNYWACALEPMSHNYWARVPQLLSPRAATTEPTCHNYWSPCTQSPCSSTREATAMRSLRTAAKSSPRSSQLKKACVQQRRPNAAKNKLINLKKKRETTVNRKKIHVHLITFVKLKCDKYHSSMLWDFKAGRDYFQLGWSEKALWKRWHLRRVLKSGIRDRRGALFRKKK